MRSLLHDLYHRPAALLVLTTLFWAGNVIVGQIAIGEITPLQLVLFRWIGVLLILWPLHGREVRESWPAIRNQLGRVIVMGASGFTIFNILFYWGSETTSAVNIGILQGSIPVFTMIGAFFFLGARAGAIQMIGVAITLIGVVLVASGGSPGDLLQLQINQGDLLMLIACFLYAAYTVMLVGRPKVPDTVFFTILATVSAITALPPAVAELFLAESYRWPTALGWVLVIYVAVFPSWLAQLFFLRGVDLIGPGRAGVYANLVPVFAAAMAVGFLGQPFETYHAIAIIAVIGGIALAQNAPRPNEATGRS